MNARRTSSVASACGCHRGVLRRPLRLFPDFPVFFYWPVAHFILALQALRLCALQTCRENLGSLLLSSLAMLSAATLSVDWTFLFILLIFIPSLLWTLIVHTVALDNLTVSWTALIPV